LVDRLDKSRLHGDPLQPKIALITGGNRGIGAAIAVRLAQDGADAAFAYLDGDAETVSSQIRDAGRRAFAVQTDLRDPLQIEQMFDRVETELGSVDILVNNAGIVRLAPFLELTLQDWTDVMDTNLRAAFLCSQRAARGMAARGFGRIVHISSTFSQVTVPHVTPYSVSKAGLAMLAKTMAVELGPRGITVNCVGPSTIRTDLNASMLDQDDMEAREARLNPTRRIGKPDDIAAIVAFLASEKASWVNGQNIIVDGGLTALSPQPPY
jgi:NAD(P)-dependent dehydrogenase (short-subunit alcohol dehydrogenase family)